MQINKKVFFTLIHDLVVLGLSFFIALWLRLENQSFQLVKDLYPYIFCFPFITIIFLYRFGLYQGIWRYASIIEILSIFKALIFSILIILAILFLSIRLESIPRSFPILLFLVSMFGVSSPRVIYRLFKDNFLKNKNNEKTKIPILVIGEGNSCESFIRALMREKDSPYKLSGILGAKDPSKGRRIHGIKIIGSINFLEEIERQINKKQLSVQRIIIADHSLSENQIEKLFIFAKRNGLAIGEIPQITDFKKKITSFETHPIEVEDVLGRKQKVHNTEKIKYFTNKIVLITGAGGSIGSELSKQIISLKPKKLLLYDNNEYHLYKIFKSLKSKVTSPILGDVKDSEKLFKIFKEESPHIIFHSAALKHITFVEDDPIEGIKTNFFGTINVINACKKFNVKNLIFVSTDKAVNPTNFMGATKRLCEKYLQYYSSKSKTIFKIVRFGNVLGSTGSVVPLFEQQIMKGGPLTITHPEVTRYFMTIREAVELVILSSTQEQVSGAVNILEMGDPVKIVDLANKMLRLSGEINKKRIEIKYTNLRKGEKLHEELFYKKELIKKTTNQSIMVTSSKVYPLDSVKYAKFLKIYKTGTESNIIKSFCTLLPEFNRLKH